MTPSCIFCSPESLGIVAKNDLAVAFRDGFPVSPLHTLVIPRRHVADLFDLTPEEVQACMDLLFSVRSEILSADSRITGFNVGVNVGTDAGQTILHCHLHLIPRRAGDVNEPIGGVRNIFPGKGSY